MPSDVQGPGVDKATAVSGSSRKGNQAAQSLEAESGLKGLVSVQTAD